MADPFTIALIAAGSSVLGSALTILISPTLQHHFWKRQRKAELRLTAISEFNRITNAYVAMCFSQTPEGLTPGEFLRDLNIAGATIRVLFSDTAYRATKQIDPLITPYATWQGPVQKRRADQFSDVCHAALTAMYREVISIPSQKA